MLQAQEYIALKMISLMRENMFYQRIFPTDKENSLTEEDYPLQKSWQEDHLVILL